MPRDQFNPAQAQEVAAAFATHSVDYMFLSSKLFGKSMKNAQSELDLQTLVALSALVLLCALSKPLQNTPRRIDDQPLG